jgi:hypothetical protein
MKIPGSRGRASARGQRMRGCCAGAGRTWDGRSHRPQQTPPCRHARPTCARPCGVPQAQPSMHPCLSHWGGRFRGCWRLSPHTQRRDSPAGLHVWERCGPRQGGAPCRPLLRIEGHCCERRPRDGGPGAARVTDEHAVAAANVEERSGENRVRWGSLTSSNGVCCADSRALRDASRARTRKGGFQGYVAADPCVREVSGAHALHPSRSQLLYRFHRVTSRLLRM